MLDQNGAQVDGVEDTGIIDRDGRIIGAPQVSVRSSVSSARACIAVCRLSSFDELKRVHDAFDNSEPPGNTECIVDSSRICRADCGRPKK